LAAKGGLTLDTCFRQFSTEELLSGSDQWYCNKCQEHRDIHKKLELFKVPEILMIQLKRFQSKKSAQDGRSGFFNLAYA
jgi:ubiquitin carboxyl-terminal hydrolase 4/11/15